VTAQATQGGPGCQVVVRGTGAIGTLSTTGGAQVIHNGTGTITTLSIGPGCVLDFSGSKDPLTVTNKVTISTGGVLNDPNGRLTLTAGWTTVDCTMAEVSTNFGPNRSYLVS
jgi:hypothetical protein